MTVFIQLQRHYVRFRLRYLPRGRRVAAHCSQGARERLHGHNYRAEVTLTSRQGQDVSDDGYLVDFGVIKDALKGCCEELDERFLCPANCSAIEITQSNDAGEPCPVVLGPFEGTGQLDIVVKHDGSRFS